MAARTKRISNDANTRAKIQAGLLIKNLSDHVFGKCEMKPTQIKAAEILLKKVLPDLQATTITADSEGVLGEILKELSGKDTGLPETVNEPRAVH